jgi:Redoxin
MGATTARVNQKKVSSSHSPYTSWRVTFVVAVVCMFGGIAARSLFWPQQEQQEAILRPPEPPVKGGKLPAFTLMPLGQSLMSGQVYTNKNLEGHKTIFLIVKATCPHCVKECTWLHTYLPKLEGRASVVVASISQADETAQFASATGISEGIYINAGTLAIEAGIQGVPDLFLVDEKGVIRYSHQGELDPEKLQFLFETFVHDGDLSQIAMQPVDLQRGVAL